MVYSKGRAGFPGIRIKTIRAAEPDQSIDLKLANEVAAYYQNPYGFVMAMYPWGHQGTILERQEGPDGWQKDFLLELGGQVKERGFDGKHAVKPVRMAIASGHGIGKSALSAWVVDWIMSTRPRSKGTITANTYQQLSTRSWAQIIAWTKICLTGRWFTITTTEMFYQHQRESWQCAAQSCKEENSEAFAGQHAADASSFYIFDEASNIPDKIFEVAEGGLTDGEPFIFLFGNPTRAEGKFFRVNFGNERERWWHQSIDSRSCKLTNKRQLQEWVEDYGEDSDFVRVRVRGECPRSGTRQLIPNDSVAFCRRYKSQGHESLPRILGIDPARYGDDRSTVILRQGRKAEIVAKFRGLDIVDLAGRIAEYMDEQAPDMTIIDADGIGAGVVDVLKHRNYRVTEYHGGGKADESNAYYNKRAECWCLLRDWLRAGAEIPDDPELAVDLTGPEYGFSNKNQVQLEKKEDMKSRGLASPDLGDALAMTFAARVLARPRRKSEIVYTYPGASSNAWMGG
jgi:hypothetical protein